MKWVSAVTREASYEDAVMAISREVNRALDGVKPDLVLVFPTAEHNEHLEELLDYLQLQLEAPLMLGSTGGGIIGAGEELEMQVGLAVMAAHLPGVDLQPFYLKPQQMQDPKNLRELIGVNWEEEACFLIFAHPPSTPEPIYQALDDAYPKSPKVGGLSSGGSDPSGFGLIRNGRVLREGLLGLALSGNIVMDTLVAQGCRPIGKPMFITRCQENLILELNEAPVNQVLQKLFSELDEGDRALFRSSLFCGLEMRPMQDSYAQGDFLMRNILGFEPNTGGLGIGAYIQEASVVQFHVRDANTSREDLLARLVAYKEKVSDNPEGILLFSCMGRGQYLYGESNHDTRCIESQFGELPIGGFFCNGEIGQVHMRTFLHGYTSSIALMRAKNPE